MTGKNIVMLKTAALLKLASKAKRTPASAMEQEKISKHKFTKL